MIIAGINVEIYSASHIHAGSIIRGFKLLEFCLHHILPDICA